MKRIVPVNIAEYLLSFGMKEYRAFVAENLQGENERAPVGMSLEDMVHIEFSPLNVVVLKKVAEVDRTGRLGINDEEFSST